MGDFPVNSRDLQRLLDRTIGLEGISGVTGDADGSLVERLTYLSDRAVSSRQRQLWVPSRFNDPIDVTISSSVALEQRVCYFKNLTINAGQVLTGMRGGNIIIVEDTLTVEGRISWDSLGALPTSKGTSTSTAGYGGGFYGYGSKGAALARTKGMWLSDGAIAANNPGINAAWARIQSLMADGGVGATDHTAPGTAGNNWHDTDGNPFTSVLTPDAPDDYWLFFTILRALLEEYARSSSTYGSIGGGAGANGLEEAANTTGAGAGGTVGGAGADSTGTRSGGGGGSGFGGGGGAGGRSTTLGGGSGGDFVKDGGRGGGVGLIICRNIDGAGSITSNGEAGEVGESQAIKFYTPSGGGGGGFNAVLYEEGSVPTQEANGGAAGGVGSQGANLSAAGAGGNGKTVDLRLRSGF